MNDVTPTSNHLPQILLDTSNDDSGADDVTRIDEIARKAKLKRVHSEKTHMTSRLSALKVATSQCDDAGVDTACKHLLLTSRDDELTASSSSVFSGGIVTMEDQDSGCEMNLRIQAKFNI